MKSDLPKSFKEGDELTASLVNGILEEIWRWRSMEAMPPIYVSQVDSKYGPPVVSFFQDIDQSQIFAGTTGGGFAAGGTPAVPKSATVTIYLDEGTGTSGGFVNTTSATAYSIYSSSVAASKTAYYWKSPNTGDYYILTADC